MQSARTQHGSMLVMAIFVITVLAFLGLAALQLLTTSSTNTVYEVYGLKARQAAQSVLEASMVNAFPLDGSVASCQEINEVFDASSGLQGCQAVSRCALQTYDNEVFLRFVSTGSCQVGEIYTQRRLMVDTVVAQ
ncbi:hypothetical protein LJ739_15440 [Aestuariibacter halophilus]|uniref:MSHA biogenesis protein MshP n=1 Tax=Fluctibacter halophilus TaxID=226011 RepID=A0ABS8GC15_9ALTE|nr:hypothetical protein [Aestuariibacter halophilus]MCC2617646.1 hypothetical protein [Aestuariibacter halophilus]